MAGSSLFTLSEAQYRIWVGFGSRFFNEIDFFAPQIANFRSPTGAALGSEGSQGAPRGPEGQSRGGGAGCSPKSGLISGEISGLADSPEGSNYRWNFRKSVPRPTHTRSAVVVGPRAGFVSRLGGRRPAEARTLCGSRRRRGWVRGPSTCVRCRALSWGAPRAHGRPWTEGTGRLAN